MKTKLLIVLTLIIISINSVSAQKNVKGYYVSVQGDTVKGTFLKYRVWDKNPAHVRFKNDHDKEILLSASEARMFQADGQYRYFSFEGYRHLNNKDQLSDTVKVQAFLKLIFESADTRLFELKDTQRSNIYLQKDDVLTELLYTQTIENGEYIVND